MLRCVLVLACLGLAISGQPLLASSHAATSGVEWLSVAHAGWVLGILTTLVAATWAYGERRRRKAAEHTRNAVVSVLEGIEAGILVFDGDLLVAHYNSQLRRLFDLPDDLMQRGASGEALLRCWGESQQIPQRDVQRILERLQRRESVTIEWPQRDGRILEVQHRPRPDGALMLSFTDITRRKKAEESSQVRGAQLRTILDRIPAGVYLANANLELVVFNQNFCDFYGFPDGMVREGTSLPSLIGWLAARGNYAETGFDLDAVVEERIQALRSGTQVTTEQRPPSGLDVLLTHGPAPDGGVCAVLVDVTDARRREREFQAFLDMAPDATVFVDQNGIIERVNRQVSNLLGYETGELEGKPVEMLVPEARRADHVGYRRKFNNAPAMRVMGDGQNLLAIKKDGTPLPVEISLGPIEFEDRTVICASIRDITERMQAQAALARAKEEAEDANQMKSAFLANMSHEIRTPMNAVVGLTHLALRNAEDARQRDYLLKIQSASDALLGVINDILDFSKIQAGKLEMESVPFELDEVLKRTSTVVSGKANEKGLELLFSVDHDVPDALIGDPLRLGQILMNLLSNAIKFTERGEIVVHIELAGTPGKRVTLRCTVRDTGIGMSAEQAARLFEPFTQADGSTTRRFGGTGLGLSICKHLVETMGGQIEVHSAVDEGSTFSFTAELGRADAAGAVRRMVPDLAGRLALVVDDNATAGKILADALESLSMQVETAPSGPRALELLHAAKRPCELVLVDWQMPEMNGIEVTRRIRADATLGKDTKVILVTAFGREEVRRDAEAAGVDAFLLKPVSRSLLVDALTEVFAATRPRPASVPIAIDDQPGFDGQRVLLVEDNEINRQVATELLNAMGLAVEIAEDGLVALEKLADPDQDFAVVLMDVQMPRLDGLSATRRIRAERRFDAVPIIGLTAHALEEERLKGVEAGMNDQVTKPIEPTLLYAALARWMGATPRSVISEAPPAEAPADIAGVDVAAGLRRSAGNQQLYHRLLRQFAREHVGTEETIRRAIDGNDLPGARALAHAVKGVAGNLGAHGVHASAAAVEAAARDGDRDAAESALPALASELHAVMQAIGETLGAGEDAPAPEMAGAVDTTSLDADVRQLLSLLDNSDADAIDRFAAVQGALSQRVGRDTCETLRRAIDGFEFDEAANLLRRALASAH